ncbi:RNA polymerase sigma factor [Pseudobacteroides cellulosolvens]|uniref:RNA polymerase, sigma-24 subunit, RpoE, ECF subfamily n=1 Tax=Pseudobacteroides cellulosolvens ATCC 35603 = DSM 2933 TaxID=398512 RepID=A0A0L6JUA5_9FIRM|nr:RNA polymerase sigma factor [Pseudobacteroides cellulosolvens]KNY29403.1 RNA polymerase, sigma-24 subunit, RpoE, ECF subfamily [Pseudobacteroides cellulosolvens ATCC 35603 = DSM 2933]
MDRTDQRELINRCQLGDLGSFEKLYELYRYKAMGTAYLIGGSRNIAEDIVQEAFVICYYQIKKLKNPDIFNIWFYRILVRVGWRMATKHKSHIDLKNTDSEQKDITCDSSRIESFADISHDRLIVRDAVKKLPPTLKTIVILYYFNELTTKEIAKILDLFQGTVKSRLHKARKLLEKELGNSFKKETVNNRKELGLNEK